MNAHTHTFELDAASLNVTPKDVECALGYIDIPAPEYLPEMIDEALATAAGLLDVHCGYHLITGPELDLTSSDVHCRDVRFNTGSIIAKRLRYSTSLALFAATIGGGIERFSRQQMAAGDMMGGFVYDTLGSVYAEAAADAIERAIDAAASEMNEKITNRYSPGYCDWSVAEQHALFTLLPPGFCGITLTSSALMLPVKSVSGIIGIGTDVKREQYQCAICDMNDCIRKKYLSTHSH
ncbi:MAG TPA: vitamin B12 dependent-methionine synthase activation domain-containing protein [Bacteroidota bacterium]|nr:vitamin B12 dependent-methionine synthase activation domain-containing protein [Bacteroidota bacterium]